MVVSNKVGGGNILSGSNTNHKATSRLKVSSLGYRIFGKYLKQREKKIKAMIRFLRKTGYVLPRSMNTNCNKYTW